MVVQVSAVYYLHTWYPSKHFTQISVQWSHWEELKTFQLGIHNMKKKNIFYIQKWVSVGITTLKTFSFSSSFCTTVNANLLSHLNDAHNPRQGRSANQSEALPYQTKIRLEFQPKA